MDIKDAYNIWAVQYDTNLNKTRDLEGLVLINELSKLSFDTCLEIGCGTGKNTVWLAQNAKSVISVDFSEEMLAIARSKIEDSHVGFRQMDILEDWQLDEKQFDLVVFSLVLEHVQNLDDIMAKVAKVLKKDGYVYIGELHPFKQYTGSKARFDTEQGTQFLTCYTHHISDFVQSGQINNMKVSSINEYFDDNNRTNLPRILSILLQKQ
jgi:ubiquinone/menaquinone biosynthesis C-methylase UbiE